MIDWIKNKLGRGTDKIEYATELIYDKEGIKAYTYLNPLQLPTMRRNALFEALNDAALGVGRDDINKFIELCEEYGNKGQYAKVMQCIGVLKFYTDQHSNSRNLFDIGCPLILIEGEDPEGYSAEHILIKKDLFTSNDDFRAFFLHRAYCYLMALSNQLTESINIGAYFSQKAVKQSELMFLDLITKNIKASAERV